jgi:hypothetical protein
MANNNKSRALTGTYKNLLYGLKRFDAIQSSKADK